VSVATVAHAPPHTEHRVWATHAFSTDHKTIAKQYLALGILWAVVGGLLAGAMRWQLAWPDTAIPLLGEIGPETYNMMVTMHGTVMVFFVAMPILLGAFGNFLIPLMIGARGMIFPRLNMLSVWTFATASVVMLASFFVPGGAASAGWTGYPPLLAEIAVLDLQAPLAQRALHAHAELIDREGLRQVVERAFLDRGDGGLDGRERGDHDHGQRRVDGVGAAQQLHAVHLGHLEIGQQEIGALGFEELETFRGLHRRRAAITLAPQDAHEVLDHVGLVVDDEDPLLAHEPITKRSVI